ncbi:hypothetical protein [Acinetobacter indicus]|uniref:hypothetical protein n=1 Tax=Acinetobacter indicus TaxID=756892 RepID=UPI0032B51469
MKKLLILLLIIGLAWMLKLSYDVFKITAQQSELSQSMHQAEKSRANLNDQLVALQRQSSNPSLSVSSSAPATDTTVQISQTTITPQQMLQQQLELIEFALKQAQYPYALEKLVALDVQLNQWALSPALAESLHQTLSKDRQLIQQFAAQRSAQQQVTQALQQLDQLLRQEIQQPQLQPAQAANPAFWHKWLKLEAAEQPATVLSQRQLLLKEAQLRLLLARQLLGQGQYLNYQQELTEILHLLKPLPDRGAQQLSAELAEIQSLTVIPVPVLTSRTLLDE